MTAEQAGASIDLSEVQAVGPLNYLQPVKGLEKRRHPRYPVSGSVFVAPYTGGPRLSLSRFIECEWLDISQGGFAFLLYEPLSHSLIVARLGAGPKSITRVARVVRKEMMRHDARGGYIHGCCFEAIPCPQITG